MISSATGSATGSIIKSLMMNVFYIVNWMSINFAAKVIIIFHFIAFSVVISKKWCIFALGNLND